MPAKKQRQQETRKRASGKPTVPKIIYAQVSPRSIGGVSMFDADDMITTETVANFTSESHLMTRTVERLQDAGFQVLQVTESTINIAGSSKTYKEAFDAEIVAEEREVMKGADKATNATFMECHNAERPGLISVANSRFDDIVEGVALEEPRYFMAPSMFPPRQSYWHLNVPADVSLGCNADRAHRKLNRPGRKIKVAMVDSGWYKHPFFVNRGYRAKPVVLGPGASNPLDDESGHGTGESANIFAVAPDVKLLPVKINFVNSVGAFNAAVGLNPDIITNSWGSDKRFGPLSAADQTLAAAVAGAVAAGITVVFSAGNGHWGFPGQHPDVISAGGVFMNPDGSFRASNYASGFMSNIYPGRRVPDVCGLVGMMPKAIYIMLPLQAGDQIDVGNSGGTHPNGDQTASNDGWAAFSGTSAAAPQIAGAAALIKQACPRLTPVQIRDILKSTARDVTSGNGHTNTGGNPATAGPDLATGHGLIDVHRAVLIAKLRCRVAVPIAPISIRPPIRPIQPVQPIRPVQPVQPIRPIQPIRPVQPVQPIRPIQPIQPIRPLEATNQLSQEVETEEPQQFLQPDPELGVGEPLDEEDVEELEEIVKQHGELDSDDSAD